MSGAGLAGAKVLVTGAEGFLGGAVRRELHRLGARTVSASRRPPGGAREPHDSAVALDLAQAAGWEGLDACGRIDAVVHCAAVLPGAAPEREMLVANQLMTYNLLAWAGTRGIGHFVLASTCRVYGLQSVPCAESAALQPPDLYAVGKASCELMAKAVLDRAGIACCTLRVAAPYGPGSRAETVVRKFLTDGAQGTPLTLQGSGARSQDFVYEDDVARAFCMALAARARGTYNVAGGACVSMRELAQAALGLFGRDPVRDIRYAGADPQEEFRGSFPVDAAYRTFGYRPQVSIEQGLGLTARAWGLL